MEAKRSRLYRGAGYPASMKQLCSHAETDMIPARDLIAKILMIALGVSAFGAFLVSWPALGDAGPDRAGAELWRMLGYLVFAGLFVLLGIFPRRMPGIWELAFMHKAGQAVLLATIVDAEGAGMAIAVDSLLSAAMLVSYLLAKGYRAWLPGRA